jgi:cold shock CspA family protein
MNSVGERITGTVKFYNPNAGYGFATDGQQDYFIGSRQLPEGVTFFQPAEQISFTVSRNPSPGKNPMALNIECLERPD